MENENYRIPIDGDWSLEDLYIFPRTYEQCYFMYLALMTDVLDQDDERVNRAYEAFPWQGGYSAVGFYNQLKWSVPEHKRPQIVRIEYASPGLIELSIVVGVAFSIERLVISLSKGARHVNETYHQIYKDLQERKLLRIKTDLEIRQLSNAEQDVVHKHAETMGDALEVDLEELNKKTGSPFKSLKILLSLYRRLRKLAEFQKKGKTKF